ncbi:MAG: hypothetical protein GY861_14210 [bacterium]|nr:hypothetical protein [bacterium]
MMLCPSVISCPDNTYKCPSGTCVSEFSLCSHTTGQKKISCATSTPILCPDLSCATSKAECKKFTECPSSAPHRCANNECRKFPENCPSTVTCPKDYPVMCADGKCMKASYHCDTIANTCTNVRCSDGTCSDSLVNCPNQVTCPKGKFKCWDGTCVTDTTEDCREPKYTDCPTENPHRCSDGSCRKNKESCSTVRICPIESPVKCWDNSCREHIDLCPEFHECGKNMRSCPDGTCTYSKCNTMVTCPLSRPKLCYDNTCVSDIRDCPTQPECEGVICPDGSCVSNRQLCKFFEPCSSKNPVRCPQGSCADSAQACDATDRKCPIGYVLCKTGGCKANEGLCDKFKCPSNLPLQCKDGTCVENLKYCDLEKNGCPYNQPHKCNDGTCVGSDRDCSKTRTRNCGEGKTECKHTDASCLEGESACKDGSCTKGKCPLANGCPSEKPTKCGDGICIDPSRDTCAPAICPMGLPIQCEDGSCVRTSKNCPDSTNKEYYSLCEKMGMKGSFMCADGRCMPSTEYCRPLYQCPSGYTRCSDGTCRLSSVLCPKSDNCPWVRPYRCDTTGRCVAVAEDCFRSCPKEKPQVCSSTGECVVDLKDCPTENKITTCKDPKQMKCADGRCFDDIEKCNTIDISCSDISKPVLCGDGQCHATVEECNDLPDSCINGMTRCQDGSCVETSKSLTECKNVNGCTLSKPFRCSDGSCASNPSQCKTTVGCSLLQPFLCGDGSCVTNMNLCKIQLPCPSSTPYRCDNKMCVESAENCEALNNFCPLSRPIKCASGKCAKSHAECSNEFHMEPCKPNEFFCMKSAMCVGSAAECWGLKDAAGSKGEASIRRNRKRQLQSQSNNTNAFDSATTDTTTNHTPENGCSQATPFSCYDGTCRSLQSECPILPACKQMEYRCSNGSCQTNKENCKNNSVICENGLNKCEDGLCRKTCPHHNGCSLAKPFQCTNGMCTKDVLECIGMSMCPETTSPFRCIDGKCVPDGNSCDPLNRVNSVIDFPISSSKYNKIDFDFAFNSQRKSIGNIFIPANSLELKNTTDYVTIQVKQIPHTELASSKVYYNNSYGLMANVSNAISSSDGLLDFENSVLSPIFNIQIQQSDSLVEDTLKFTGVITLEHNYYHMNLFRTNDYCLARLEENAWLCVSRKESDEQKQFNFVNLGTYAIILNPYREAPKIDDSSGMSFFKDNLQTIVIVLGVLFIVSVLIFYIFTRVIRYREKYKEMKEMHINIQNEKEDYKMMSTDIPGQTLGDTLKGMVFTKNPAHSVTTSGGANSQIENDIEDLQMKCRSMDGQNKSMEEKINDMNDQYKMLRMEIERLKNQGNE